MDNRIRLFKYICDFYDIDHNQISHKGVVGACNYLDAYKQLLTYYEFPDDDNICFISIEMCGDDVMPFDAHKAVTITLPDDDIFLASNN